MYRPEAEKFKLEKVENECARNRSIGKEHNNRSEAQIKRTGMLKNNAAQPKRTQLAQRAVQQRKSQTRREVNKGRKYTVQGERVQTPKTTNGERRQLIGQK